MAANNEVAALPLRCDGRSFQPMLLLALVPMRDVVHAPELVASTRAANSSNATDAAIIIVIIACVKRVSKSLSTS